MAEESIRILLVQSDEDAATVIREFLVDHMGVEVEEEIVYTGYQVGRLFHNDARVLFPNVVLADTQLATGDPTPLRLIIRGLSCRRPSRSGLIVTSVFPTVDLTDEDMAYINLITPFQLSALRTVVLRMQAFISGQLFAE